MAAKPKQDDLRKLMKERRENFKAKEKIDSPFAKYNNAGQLLCVICNVQVKSNNLWFAHIAGKIHKENVLKKKSTTEVPQRKNTTEVVQNTGQKRTANQSTKDAKKVKSADPLQESRIAKNAVNIALLEGYSSSEDENENSKETSSASVIQSAEQNVLPKDFFDSAPDALVSSEKNPSNGKELPETSKSNVDTLPEGFFDDPILDAKARNIEYKDPVEEEWEKFQKTIAEETNVSKTIIEEDLEESTLERDIMQIDEQIHQWQRVKKLQSLADDVKLKASSKNEDMDNSDSTDEDLEEDDLLDWRSKGVKKL